MNVEVFVAAIVFVIGIILSAISIRVIKSNQYESREARLEKEITKLKNAMEVLNEDRLKDRAEIDSLKKQLAISNERIRELETTIAMYQSASTDKRKSDILLVVIGGDAKLKIDLATLRAVKRITGMNFTRLLNARFSDFHRVMSEARLSGKPYKYILFSVHSGDMGIQLDTVIDAEELSAEVQDAEVLMIAGCESSNMGQWLGVVPYVITLREEVPMDDASRFVEAFWTSVGNGDTPEKAFYTAVDKVPTVGEYAELHC